MSATRAERIAAYVEKSVAEAPPLTDAQRDRIAALLLPTSKGREDAARRVRLRETEAETARLAEEHRHQYGLAEARRLAAAVMRCDVCNLPPEAHVTGSHRWEPGRAERVIRETAGIPYPNESHQEDYQ